MTILLCVVGALVLGAWGVVALGAWADRRAGQLYEEAFRGHS